MVKSVNPVMPSEHIQGYLYVNALSIKWSIVTQLTTSMRMFITIEIMSVSYTIGAFQIYVRCIVSK